MSRRLMLRNERGTPPILPSEFQQVEYIESRGQLYILTPLSGVMKGYTVHCWLGHRDEMPGTSEPVFGMYRYVGGQVLSRYTSGNYGVNGDGTSYGNKYAGIPSDQLCECIIHFHNSDQSGTLDGKEIYGYKYNNYQTGSWYLFGTQKYGGSTWYYYKGFLGRFTVYNTTTLDVVLDLVPCYRKADNVIGMYDLVTDTFVTKTGTGTLTKGADVN